MLVLICVCFSFCSFIFVICIRDCNHSTQFCSFFCLFRLGSVCDAFCLTWNWMKKERRKKKNVHTNAYTHIHYAHPTAVHRTLYTHMVALYSEPIFQKLNVIQLLLKWSVIEIFNFWQSLDQFNEYRITFGMHVQRKRKKHFQWFIWNEIDEEKTQA